MKNERGTKMKRIICALLALCLISSVSIAEMSNKTDEELKNDFRSIVAELISRGIWGTDVINAGFYIVGQSIPNGTFELTPDKHGTIEIYPGLEQYSERKGRILYLIFEEGETFTITLSEGMTVDLESKCTIKPFSFSW